MLILGQKYKFTKLELQRLDKIFGDIATISYKDENADDVIAKIEVALQENSITTILLNTKEKVDEDIIKYLTNLKFNVEHSKFNIIAIEHFLEKYLHKCYIPEDNNDLHFLDDIEEFSISQKMQKGVVDVVAVFFLFIVFLALKPIVKKKITKESPGDIYFRQSRVGYANKEFQCIKFRSMNEHDSEKDVRTAIKDDDRKFPFGETMRKLRIDELPQIINILKGEMSLIGPRAEWNKLVEDYEKQIPYYKQRHIVKPGITGWAQVMFAEGRHKEDTRQKLMYDLYYIKHWSIVLEMKVIYKTVMVVLNRQGV